MTAFADRYTAEESRTDVVLQWAALCAAVVLVFDYGISDKYRIFQSGEKVREDVCVLCTSAGPDRADSRILSGDSHCIGGSHRL